MKTKKKVENIFSDMDHMIVRAAVKRLPGLLSEVMTLRFWQNYSVAEIADEIGVSMKTVDEAILNAGRMLREECLRNPIFSRSLHAEIRRFGFDAAA